MSLKILLADDHSVVRNGVSIILNEGFRELKIKSAQNFSEVLLLLEDFSPDVILLDINIPGGNSTTMIEKIRQIAPKVNVMMFSGHEETQYALRYLHAGANGFLSKDASEKEIVEAVRTLLETGKYISRVLKEKILENALYEIPANPLESLSNREIEIAELLAAGNGNLEISNLLDIKMTTVSTYKNRIFEKLNINNVVTLAEMLRIYKN